MNAGRAGSRRTGKTPIVATKSTTILLEEGAARAKKAMVRECAFDHFVAAASAKIVTASARAPPGLMRARILGTEQTSG